VPSVDLTDLTDLTDLELETGTRACRALTS
jgi:hypothetical protein